MISNSCQDALPLYTQPSLGGDLWDLTWLNHIIVLYGSAANSELHRRFLALFKLVAYSALCNKAVADQYYEKMRPEIAKVIEEQGGERALDANLFYLGSAKNFASTSLQKDCIPIYADSIDSLTVVSDVSLFTRSVSRKPHSSKPKPSNQLGLVQKLWVSYREHPHQTSFADLPTFRLFVQGTLAREKGLFDLITSIVCAGWASGYKADELPAQKCGVSSPIWALFADYTWSLSSLGGFAKLPLFLQTLVLESALALTATNLYGLKVKTQVGSWLDWHVLFKRGPVVVRATIGDRYQKGAAIPTGEQWASEPIFAYPITAARIKYYATADAFHKNISAVIAANALILVGGESVNTKKEGYGKSRIYFRQTLNGPLFMMVWNEFLLNLVSFDGLLYSSTPQGRQPEAKLIKSAPPPAAVWAIHA